MNSLASVMVNNAQTMVNMANSIESANIMQNQTVNASTNAIANVANATMNSASTVNSAVKTANVAVTAASAVNTSASVNTGVTSVVQSVMKGNAAVANAVVNSANAVLKNNTVTNGSVAANIVANAAVNVAANVELNEASKVSNMTKNLNKKLNVTKKTIEPTNPMREKFAKAISVNAKNVKKMLYTAEGEVKTVMNKNGGKVINVNGKPRVVVPKLETRSLNAHNKSSGTKTGRQVYKQGNLKNVYKNKNGKMYTIMNGAMGNMKNYLFKGANGLFSGSLLK